VGEYEKITSHHSEKTSQIQLTTAAPKSQAIKHHNPG
jgi:hypothetical protein